MSIATSKITPCLWFDKQASEAAQFYASLFPNSEIHVVQKSASYSPGGKLGEVLMVTLPVAGLHLQALDGGRYETFNNAISLSVDCADQAEVDRFWAALTADGGKPIQRGWLKDKYGLSWQIVPRRLTELLSGPDPAKAKRVMQAMMDMVKLDVSKLEAAAKAG